MVTKYTADSDERARQILKAAQFELYLAYSVAAVAIIFAAVVLYIFANA